MASDEIPQFRSFLNTIADELDSGELDELKFLCPPRLTKARLAKVTTPQHLFVAIGEVISDEEGQLNLLKQLLQGIRRFDLKSKVEKFQLQRRAQVTPPDHTYNNGEGTDSQGRYAPSSGPRHGGGFQPQQTENRYSSQYSVPFSHQVESPPPPVVEHPSYGGYGYTSSPSEARTEGVVTPQSTEQVHAAGYQPQHESQYQSEHHAVENNMRASFARLSVQSPPHHQTDSRQPRTEAVNHSSFSTNISEPLRETGLFVQSRTETVQSEPSSGYTWMSQPHRDFDQSRTGNVQAAPSSGYTCISEPQHETDFVQSRTETVQATSPSPYVSQPHGRTDTANPSSGLTSQQSVPFGQEEQTPFQSEDQLDQGSSQPSSLDVSGPGTDELGPVESAHKEKTAAENVEAPHDSSGDAVIHADKRCPIEMTYSSMRNFYHEEPGTKLGVGGFGTVYRGCNKFNGQDVVIKVEHRHPSGQDYRAAQLKREKMVGFIKHPHLMPLYAVCEEKGRPLCLMYPLMHSDLRKALRRDLKGRESLPWECRVQISLHTAKGLLYLHSRVGNERSVRQEIVHMDVKPGNIFLDEDLNARLGDPGMAQELQVGFSFASISQMRGTDGYLDPYLQDTHFKPVNDIYSFGVVMLELLTQKDAVELRAANKNVKLRDALKQDGSLSTPETLMKKARSVWPESDSTRSFCAITIDCLKKPKERATLPDICQRLEEILEKQGQEKVSKPKERRRCASCLLNVPAKHLGVKSSRCGSEIGQSCNHFCISCLVQAQRNPVECPSHGPAEPPIGRTNTYAILVCGDDINNAKAAAAFRSDVNNFRNTLTDNRIVGVRNDHLYCITPLSCESSVGSEVKKTLQQLKLELQGKNDVFLYFYFSGHSDQNGNLVCSSTKDLITEDDLRRDFKQLNVEEFIVILDCCFADGKIASEHLDNDSFLVSKSANSTQDTTVSPQQPPAECPQHPLESLWNLQEQACDDGKPRAVEEPHTCVTEDTDLDSLDGAVIAKSPHSLEGGPGNIRQWSSSMSRQESLAVHRGSFFTQFMICGLRGAHECRLKRLLQSSDCFICKRFQARVSAVGYITAEDLENYISEHVTQFATALERLQVPRMRALHSKETILAYYNERKVCDEIKFKAASGSSEMISITKFQPSLVDFQSYIISAVKDKIPPCSKPKHIQVLCDEEEIDSSSFHDVKHFARQGYDVKCQLRPCTSIDKGPVMVESQNSKELVESFLDCVGLKRCQNTAGLQLFQADTSERTYTEADVNDTFEEDPKLCDLVKTLVNSITVMLKTASLHKGLLSIQVFEQHLDCELRLPITDDCDDDKKLGSSSD